MLAKIKHDNAKNVLEKTRLLVLSYAMFTLYWVSFAPQENHTG